MNGWMVAGLAFAGFVVWTLVLNWRERGRQRALAATRLALDAEMFEAEMGEYGIRAEVAAFM